jgi:cyclin-dependent kinase regulatory subunit CKS1
MSIIYSDKYSDDTYEYRHVILPEEVKNMLPKDYLDFYKPENVFKRNQEWEQKWQSAQIDGTAVQMEYP